MPVKNPAQQTSVAELMLRAKQRADIEKSGSAGVISDQELINLLNLYYRSLAQKVDHKYEYYRAKYTNLQTRPNQLTYPLPADFYVLLGLGLVTSPGAAPDTWTPLSRWEMQNQNVPGTGFFQFTNGVFNSMTYRIVGPNVEFRPVKSAQTVGMWYVPQVPKLVSPDDVLEDWVMPGWEEYMVAGAAMMIAAKEQMALGMMAEIWRMIDQQIDSFVPDRDSFSPDLVIRTDWQARGGNGLPRGWGDW